MKISGNMVSEGSQWFRVSMLVMVKMMLGLGDGLSLPKGMTVGSLKRLSTGSISKSAKVSSGFGERVSDMSGGFYLDLLKR